MMTENEMLDNEAIHAWFGLTYANYLVIPRVALQSMPPEWQRNFVKLVNEIEETLPDYSEMIPDCYQVQCKDYDGKFVKDKFPHYQRGRARLKSMHNNP